jgi:hypothetical protein
MTCGPCLQGLSGRLARLASGFLDRLIALDALERLATLTFAFAIRIQYAGGHCFFAREENAFCEPFLLAEGVGGNFSATGAVSQACADAAFRFDKGLLMHRARPE